MVVVGRRYQHVKSGKCYEVTNVALDVSTESLVIVYEPLYECEYDSFTRPIDDFCSKFEILLVSPKRLIRSNDKSSGDKNESI